MGVLSSANWITNIGKDIFHFDLKHHVENKMGTHHKANNLAHAFGKVVNNTVINERSESMNEHSASRNVPRGALIGDLNRWPWHGQNEFLAHHPAKSINWWQNIKNATQNFVSAFTKHDAVGAA